MPFRAVSRSFLLLAALSAACNAPPLTPATTPKIETNPPASELLDRAKMEAERDQFQAARDVFEHRCVVCHGCYDAPCQLILSSPQGLERGGSKINIYDSARLLAIEPTRLFIDAHDVRGWREKKFHPVLPDDSALDPRASLLIQMLELKQQHPLPASGPLPDEFELGVDRKAVCPTRDEFADYAADHPLWGMPYALPGLSHEEHEKLVAWVNAGAPSFPPPALAPEVLDAVTRWEAFLNDPTPKARLMARYIYEHLFLASLYFVPLDHQRTFFRLVRSRTPSGQPIQEIPTRRPFDDPGKEAFYYRLQHRHSTVLTKTHMPYALSERRMARWQELFLKPDYEVGQLPSYDLKTASNPFSAFHAIPANSRYRFMLDEAEFTMMGFIKGPVCRGQVALDVIQDRFWITFVNPDSPALAAEDDFLAQNERLLALPAEQGSNGHLLEWFRYARAEKKYLAAKSQLLAARSKVPGSVSLDVVWNGDGQNANAALTVIRNFDSATVMKGFAGDPPKTAWLVSYALLERIHYLLTAGFDVFGNVGHQLDTRMYMDFLRMESEHNFIALLPKKRRQAVVDDWYRNASDDVKNQVYGKIAKFERETDITYRTDKPETELMNMLAERLAPVLDARAALSQLSDEGVRGVLSALTTTRGQPATIMPEMSFLEVRDGQSAPQYFTLLRDTALSNVAHLFRETERRLPAEDELTVLRGFVGAYPDAVFSVERRELPQFTDSVAALRDYDAYQRMYARFGVSRMAPNFWPTIDRFHEAFSKLAPVEAGLFDLNRLDPL